MAIYSKNKARLFFLNATGDAVTIGNTSSVIRNVTLEGLYFGQGAGVEKTSGSHINIVNCDEIELRKLYMGDIYDGITCDGIARSEFTDIWFRRQSGRSAPSRHCFNLFANATTGLPVVNLKLTRCDAVDPIKFQTFVKLSSADWVNMLACHANFTEHFLHITHGAANIVDVYVNNCYMDLAYDSNVLIDGAGGGLCDGIKFNNTYFRASEGYGLEVVGTGAIQNITVSSNCRFDNSELGAIKITNEAVVTFHLDDCVIGRDIGAGNARPIIETHALRNKISGNSFRVNSGLVDIKAERSTPSGVLLVTGNIFNASGSSSVIAQTNFVDVEYAANTGLGDIPLAMGLKQSGSVTGTTNSAYGGFGLYASANVAVLFSPAFSATPTVNLNADTGGGVTGVAVNNITASGFNAVFYGVTNGGTPTAQWDAYI